MIFLSKFKDRSIPIRPGYPRAREVQERRSLLGPGGAQKHGLLRLLQAKTANCFQLDQTSPLCWSRLRRIRRCWFQTSKISTKRWNAIICLGSQDRARQVYERRFPKGRQGSTVQISQLFYHLQSTDSFHKEKNCCFGVFPWSTFVPVVQKYFRTFKHKPPSSPFNVQKNVLKHPTNPFACSCVWGITLKTIIYSAIILATQSF